MKTKRTMKLVVVMLAMAAVAGCLQRPAIVKDMFMLDAKRTAGAAKPASDAVLSVRPFSIAPAFQAKGFVSRTGADQYESDYYNEYFISPAAMLTEQTRDWLADSGLFGRVLLPVSSAEPTHLLEGHISQIAADTRDSENPKAVLEMSFFLLAQEKRERTVLFRKRYSAARGIREKTAPAYIAALNECLRDILQNLEQDLASQALEP